MELFVLPDAVQSLVDRGALFVINSSGGKDSQAMTIALALSAPVHDWAADAAIRSDRG